MKIEERIEELSSQLYEKFKDYGISKKEIAKRLKLLLLEFKVPETEALRTITNYLVREYQIPKEEVRAPTTKVFEIKEPGRWISVKAKVVQLWEPTSPSISQTGLIGDETGLVRFLIWSKAGKPEVEEGKCYLFKNVVTDEFGGSMRINVTRYSEIEEINEDIKVSEELRYPGELEIVGSLVAIQQNSGLIQRCNECGRVVKSGMCPVHGKVGWYDDLRIRGVIDNGENTYEIILNEENIKDLTGIDLEGAKKMAKENLDRSVVLSELKRMLLGKYLKVGGDLVGRFLMVRRVEFYKPEITAEIEKLLEIIG
ncbi:replication protein A [Archaeoglobales archaeon]|nr:MAG: replication protein A [Archaeoglobales archaeon]HDN74030.1 replication protein A [Archaeoglobus sp.]